MSSACSLFHLDHDDGTEYTMGDYEGAIARWCPGCGDHGVLTSIQRLLAGAQLKPEDTVFVSGIGCSSRLPHYVNTYGFHGIHGRALPIATGIKLNRPDLKVFVVMGDGDCTSIGAGHWIHAVRYNVDMVALLLDNNIYGLTQKQTSPPTPQGYTSNTQPRGSYLPPLNPIEATLGVTNASFVAQTAEWVPQHMFETLKQAYDHKGFSFVRIMQRCPHFTADLFQRAVREPDALEFMVHENGIDLPDLTKIYKNRVVHDPSDIDAARSMAKESENLRIGVFFRDEDRPIYEETRHLSHLTVDQKMEIMEKEFDRYAV